MFHIKRSATFPFLGLREALQHCLLTAEADCVACKCLTEISVFMSLFNGALCSSCSSVMCLHVNNSWRVWALLAHYRWPSRADFEVDLGFKGHLKCSFIHPGLLLWISTNPITHIHAIKRLWIDYIIFSDVWWPMKYIVFYIMLLVCTFLYDFVA